jgi:UDP-glucose 6-dehydrogenase
VICVDKDADKIGLLCGGKIPIYESGLDEIVARNVGEGRLAFSTDLADAVKKSDAVFIAVGTPPRADGSANLAYVEDVALGMGLDKRIGRDFLKAGPGYGGSCLPKDTMAIVSMARNHGERLSIVEATIEANKAQRRKMLEKIEGGLAERDLSGGRLSR